MDIAIGPSIPKDPTKEVGQLHPTGDKGSRHATSRQRKGSRTKNRRHRLRLRFIAAPPIYACSLLAWFLSA
jgi:hypothetical protein